MGNCIRACFNWLRSVLGRTETPDEAHQKRSELKQKEDELESLNKSRLTQMETSHEKELEEMRSELKQKEDELESLNKRLTQMETSHEKELEEMRTNFRKKEEELESLNRRSELKQKEDELESLNKSRLTQMETSHEKELEEMRTNFRKKEEELESLNRRSELKQKEDELESLNKSRLTQMKTSHEKELEEMRTNFRKKEEELESLNRRLQEAPALRSSLQHCKPQGCEHKQSLTQLEFFYKKTINEARSAAAQKEKELKSLKDRLAAQVAISLKTGNTESMNNPVSKTRLTEMYDNLKLLQWPNIKDRLKSRKIGPKEAKDLIQRTFGDAAEEMKRRKQQIEEMFQETSSSSGPTPQKVKEYRQLTVQNLQMALFHTSKEDLFKTGFLEHGGQFPGEVKEDLRLLASECYWLGCLMALNIPPLQPDWKNHFPGFDSWDIFPRDIQPFVL
ncbi:vicilin-like seed storage protein At2g18540 [Cyprinodon tularosa]|uniref:vicilin-like seed storage protein At2g18540 n=1 Tax=Cyprinodon tularosa TaxID=77115 RepID=UPI0018E1E2CD|nr:vicilin-like seed storage protein At2g18540 [Cyprinodon tularosa]